MRIGFDVSQTCASRAGCAWHADSLAKSLAKLIGPENLILYHNFGNWINGRTQTGTLINGCESPFFDVGFEESRRIWYQIESGTKSLPGKPDIVHSNSYMAPHLGGTPLVYTIHDLCFLTHPQFTTKENQRFCTKELTKALRHADAFHFISRTTLEDFNQLYPDYLEISQKPFRVIHSGPRLGSLGKQISENSFTAPWLFIGTIEPRKNIEGLLNAFEIYLKASTNPRPLFIAGGEGWLSDSIHKRFDRLTKLGVFRYLGQISDDELDLLYNTSFGLLFPSHYEGFGLPVIEAMNYSLPVISNNIKSIQELASDVATFVNFDEADTVVSNMMALESDESYYKKQAEKSKSAASAFSWTKTADQLVPLYQAALKFAESKQIKCR